MPPPGKIEFRNRPGIIGLNLICIKFYNSLFVLVFHGSFFYIGKSKELRRKMLKEGSGVSVVALKSLN